MSFTTATTIETKAALDNAKGWAENIEAGFAAVRFCEKGYHPLSQQANDLPDDVKAILKAQGYDDTNADVVREWIEDEIREAVLSVDVRSGWRSPGDGASAEPEEFQLLLTTGGPGLRIRGYLQHSAPERCWMEFQDWGIPWTRFDTVDPEALLWFAGLFWYGD